MWNGMKRNTIRANRRSRNEMHTNWMDWINIWSNVLLAALRVFKCVCVCVWILKTFFLFRYIGAFSFCFYISHHCISLSDWTATPTNQTLHICTWSMQSILTTPPPPYVHHSCDWAGLGFRNVLLCLNSLLAISSTINIRYDRLWNRMQMWLVHCT